jgi:hypothetical protein
MGEAEKHQIFLQLTGIWTVRISPKLRWCKQNLVEMGGFGGRSEPAAGGALERHD